MQPLSPALSCAFFFFFNDTATTEIYTLSLHDALPIFERLAPAVQLLLRAEIGAAQGREVSFVGRPDGNGRIVDARVVARSEEHTSELQSRLHLVCRLLLEKKKKNILHVRCRQQCEDTN